MALVTKRVYPTEIPSQFYSYYNIGLDTFTSGTGYVGGVFDYWYTVTARGSVGLSDRVYGYMRFDISSIKNAINAKFIYSVSNNNSTFNSTLVNSANMYYNVSSNGPDTNSSFGLSSGGEINITDITGLNHYNSVRFDFLCVANSMNRKNTATGSWTDYTVASISAPSNNWASRVRMNVNSNIQSHYIEYQIYEPVITNLEITGANIDNQIIATWENEDVETWKLEALQNNIVVATLTGTTQNTATFTPGTIKKKGNTVFKLTATGGGASTTSETTKILTWNDPFVSTLEPNNLNKLLSQSILVEFSGINISSWKYEAIQGAVAKYTTTGTTLRQSTIPPDIFSTGSVTSRLTVTYIPAWATSPSDYRTVVKEVTFTAYGPPPNPTLNLSSIYNTAFPLFSWTASNEQMAWQLKVLDGVITVIDTGETVNTARQYQHNNPLENNKVYQAQLRIRNQYNLYSSWVSATFQVSYAELAQPTFNIYANHVDACIVLNIYNGDDENFYKSQVYRRETGTATWLQIADNLAQNDEFKDFECASGIEYEYKVRALSSELTYTDSDVKTMSVKFSYPRLSIAGTNDFIILDSNFEVGTSYNDGKSYQLYAGLSEPKESRSLTNYRVFEVKCSLKYSGLNNFMRIINTQGSLFLRDSKGLAVYGTVSLKSKGENVLFSYCSLVFVFTETYYGGAQDVVQPECNEFSIKEW